jgi:hypothetical protein
MPSYRARAAMATTPMMGATKPRAPLVLGRVVLLVVAADEVLLVAEEATDWLETDWRSCWIIINPL